MIKIYSNQKELSSRNINDHIFKKIDPKRVMYVHICVTHMGTIEEVVQTIKL